MTEEDRTGAKSVLFGILKGANEPLTTAELWAAAEVRLLPHPVQVQASLPLEKCNTPGANAHAGGGDEEQTLYEADAAAHEEGAVH